MEVGTKIAIPTWISRAAESPYLSFTLPASCTDLASLCCSFHGLANAVDKRTANTCALAMPVPGFLTVTYPLSLSLSSAPSFLYPLHRLGTDHACRASEEAGHVTQLTGTTLALSNSKAITLTLSNSEAIAMQRWAQKHSRGLNSPSCTYRSQLLSHRITERGATVRHKKIRKPCLPRQFIGNSIYLTRKSTTIRFHMCAQRAERIWPSSMNSLIVITRHQMSGVHRRLPWEHSTQAPS